MYRAPVSEIAFALKQIAGLKQALEVGIFGDLSEELVDAVLTEAGKFASEEIAPLNRIGDEIGAKLKDGVVTTAPGFSGTYKKWCEAGWNAISAPETFGGQGLPTMLGLAATEMWNSASMGFGLCPLLTVGAIEALEKHGSDELKTRYLEKLVSGEYSGTMNLTEPQAGSDLSAIKTKAEPASDGSYRLSGQKIFITYGEHDMAENICHLVLARLPDAPPDTKGISLFLVPKFIVGEDGTIGERNDVFCQSIEEKLGIHASPTCVMIYGDGWKGSPIGSKNPGALGWLIGEENRGLSAMFTMMNNARLNVAIQGVAVGEAAYQQALSYAGERKQGKTGGSSEMVPIIAHPDVQRNLLTMKAMIRAARAICYCCAHAIDMQHLTQRTDEAEKWANRAGLLTPLAKSYATDIGVEVASIGVQIHGGMGFIEETGAAQLLRDARINPIYEGTNGIHAIDLVRRKLPLAGGEAIKAYIAELRQITEAVKNSNQPGFGKTAGYLGDALDKIEAASDWLLEKLAKGEIEAVLCGATPFQKLLSLGAGGAYLAKAGLAAQDDIVQNHIAQNHIALARFFAENLLGECDGLARNVIEGSEGLIAAKALLEAG